MQIILIQYNTVFTLAKYWVWTVRTWSWYMLKLFFHSYILPTLTWWLSWDDLCGYLAVYFIPQRAIQHNQYVSITSSSDRYQQLQQVSATKTRHNNSTSSSIIWNCLWRSRAKSRFCNTTSYFATASCNKHIHRSSHTTNHVSRNHHVNVLQTSVKCNMVLHYNYVI